MLKDFKAFVMRGNIIDLSVGVIIGAAFDKIVSSFVKDILTPPIGLLLGNVDFTNLFVSISGGHYKTLEEAKAAGAVTLNIGLFLNNVIHFLIIASVIFVFISQINRFKHPAEAKTKSCPYCLTNVPLGATRCPACTSDLKGS